MMSTFAQTMANILKEETVTDHEFITYRCYDIEHAWCVNVATGIRVDGTDEYFVYDEDGIPFSHCFDSLAEAKQYIDSWVD